MELNLVTVTILNALLASEGCAPIADITEHLSISRRTLNYNLSKLNYALEREGFPQVVPADGHLSLDVTQKAEMQRWLANHSLHNYVLSSGERQLLISLSVGLMGAQTSLESLCSLMGVSRNTVLGDITELKQRLLQSGLTLSSCGKQGYQITGDELTLRYCIYENLIRAENDFIRTLAEQLLLCASRTRGMQFETCDALTDWLCGLIKQAEDCVDGRYNHNSIQEISTYLILILCRAGEGSLYLDGEEIRRTREYQMALHLAEMLRQNGAVLPEQECLYLASILLGAKLYSYHEVARRGSVDLRQLADDLVDTFETKACVQFSNREQLIDQFMVHLRPLYYRLKYHVKVRNLLYSKIRREYQGIYDLTSLAASVFKEHCGLEIPEEELAYISVYLLTWLKRQHLSQESGSRRILVVCGAGIGTSLLLRQQVSEILGMGYRYETRDAREVDAMDLRQYDLIVTTVDLPADRGTILKADPILNTRQKERLLNWSCSRSGGDTIQHQIDQVLAAVEARGTIQDRTGLTIDLRRIFEQSQGAEQGPGLWDVLTPDMIRICSRRLDAPQSIEYACASLVSHGLVGPDYARSVLEIVDQLGLYAEISPGVLLAHAKPDSSVHGVGLSLTVFREQVEFPKWGKRITTVFTLCTPDNQGHLRLLRELMHLLDREDVRSILVSCPYQSSDRLYRFLRRAEQAPGTEA